MQQDYEIHIRKFKWTIQFSEGAGEAQAKDEGFFNEPPPPPACFSTRLDQNTEKVFEAEHVNF